MTLRQKIIGQTRLVVAQGVFSWLPQTEIWIYNQIKSLDSSIESHIICEFSTNLKQFALPNILCLQKKYPICYFYEKLLQKTGLHYHSGLLKRQMMSLRIDILHSHFANYAWFNQAAARAVQAKHVVTFYGFDVNMLPTQFPVWKRRYQELFDSAILFLCEGPHMAQCIQKLGCPKDKILVHHLGVDVNNIRFEKRTWNGNDPFRILIAGTFQEKKGIPIALETISQIRDVSVEITIIGDATREKRSQDEKKRIMNAIKCFHLKSQVRLLGYQPYEVLIHESYQHHLFLATSKTASNGDTEGGAPVILMDMMAAGLPIVSTRHCDIPEVINHGETGLLADEGNADQLITHVRWFISQYNSHKRVEMTEKARCNIEERFNTTRQGKELSEIYRSL